MASAATVEYADTIGSVQKIFVAWTALSTGGVAVTTKEIRGKVVRAVTDPGSPAPGANYDIVITDPEGINILAQSQDDLVNRSSNTSEQVYFNLAFAAQTAVVADYPIVNDKLTITVTNAENAASTEPQGQLILYVDQLR